MKAQLQFKFIATGGTISGLSDGKGGYKSGQLNAADLLGEAATVAAWDIEQPYKMGSQHATFKHFAALGDCLRAALLDEAVDGVLISHGTDTLEELMLYLSARFGLLSKPVVLVASMRPADHPEADGPNNLSHAITVLELLAREGEGLHLLPVLVMSSKVTVSIDAIKRSASSVEAFSGQHSINVLDNDLCGKISRRSRHLEKEIAFHFADLSANDQAPGHSERAFDLSVATGRSVEVVYVNVGMTAGVVELIDAACTSSCVVASPGNASLPDYLIDSLEGLIDKGVRVMVASRLGCEGVSIGFEINRLSEKVSYAPSGWSLPQVIFLERLRAGQV